MLPSYLRINVTQTCINYGEICDCDTCPIALAVQAAMNEIGHTARVRVGSHEVYILDDTHKWDAFAMPAVALQFLKDFDQGKPVQPFDFLLSL